MKYRPVCLQYTQTKLEQGEPKWPKLPIHPHMVMPSVMLRAKIGVFGLLLRTEYITIWSSFVQLQGCLCCIQLRGLDLQWCAHTIQLLPNVLQQSKTHISPIFLSKANQIWQRVRVLLESFSISESISI